MSEREIPLSANELVYGDYLTYDCCGHDGTEIIYTFESLDVLANHIMCEAVIQNLFTTYNIAFEHGEVKHYEIYEQGKFVV
ncbi:hypothetical protein J6TS2_07280 [Heyndrickxia sporothermodurans]|nr:hypothetical protein J6TS2_07280 [Heyndrickxia sporothermodurans]